MVTKGLKDLESVRKLMSSAKGAVEAAKIKDALRGEGYKYEMSLYGVLKAVETNRLEYRRIEVLTNILGNERIINLIYRFFQTNKPIKTYTIWIYNSELDSIRLVYETW